MSDYLDRLNAGRLRAWNEAKELLDRASAEDRDLTVDERTKWDNINADIDERDSIISRALELEQREREADVARAAYEQIVRPPVDATVASRTADDDLRSFLRGDGRRALDVDLTAVAAEKRAIRAGADSKELRDLTYYTAGSGANLLPTSFSRQLYDYLEVYSGVRRLNVTILTTSTGEALQLPTVTSHGTAAAVGMGTAIAEADAAFGQITLNSYKYGQMVQAPRELIEDSGVDLEGFLATDLARAIARVTDTAYVLGAGTNAPNGLDHAGFGTAATGGTGVVGAPTYANLVTTAYGVNEEYRLDGAYWLARDATFGVVRALTDTTNRPIWEPSSQVGQPDRLLGYPVVSDPNVPAAATNAHSIYFGNFRGFVIRDVGSVRLESSDDFAFSSDLRTWKATFRTDSDSRDVNAVVTFRGGTA